MIVVTARVPILPDRRDAFLASARACVAATRQEAGCEGYDIYESVTSPELFVSIERWSSRAALDRHYAAAHVQALFGVIAETASAPPVIEEIVPAAPAGMDGS